MTDFNFSKEMVYGKKHIQKIDFNIKEYKFIELVTNLFECELCELHNSSNNKYELFTELGKDSHTEFHKKFYNKLDDQWKEIKDEYSKFINNTILPYLGLEEALVQTFPTFRIHLPNNVAIVVNHYDSDSNHNHPTGEINFIFALTNMFDTNTVYIEKMPRLEEYEPVLLNSGECICFNGNKCSHYNKINKTGKTRVSWDFRVLPLNYYDKENELISVTTKTKYREGEYYTRYKLNEIKPYIARDIWDKEKENFNHIMKKYNVNDAWGVVDLFEKKNSKIFR